MARWLVQFPGLAPSAPRDASELQGAWQRREIPPGTLVCAEGYAQWVPFDSVAELVAPPGAVTRASSSPAQPPTGLGAAGPTPVDKAGSPPSSFTRTMWTVAVLLALGWLYGGFQLVRGAARAASAKGDSAGGTVMLLLMETVGLVWPIALLAMSTYKLTRRPLVAAIALVIAVAGVGGLWFFGEREPGYVLSDVAARAGSSIACERLEDIQAVIAEDTVVGVPGCFLVASYSRVTVRGHGELTIAGEVNHYDEVDFIDCGGGDDVLHCKGKRGFVPHWHVHLGDLPSGPYECPELATCCAQAGGDVPWAIRVHCLSTLKTGGAMGCGTDVTQVLSDYGDKQFNPTGIKPPSGCSSGEAASSSASSDAPSTMPPPVAASSALARRAAQRATPPNVPVAPSSAPMPLPPDNPSPVVNPRPAVSVPASPPPVNPVAVRLQQCCSAMHAGLGQFTGKDLKRMTSAAAQCDLVATQAAGGGTPDLASVKHIVHSRPMPPACSGVF